MNKFKALIMNFKKKFPIKIISKMINNTLKMKKIIKFLKAKISNRKVKIKIIVIMIEINNKERK